jgi:signal transduction histidine kinase
VLHDDVLPCLHTVMLMLRSGGDDEAATQTEEKTRAVALLADVHHQIANLLRDMPTAPAIEVASLGLEGALRQTVSGELRHAFDEVVWRIDPEAEQALRTLPPLTAEVLAYAAREAMRNAARYGRNGDPHRPLRLTVSITYRDGLEIAMEDDGVGLAATGPSGAGSGQGLTLHSTMMAIVGGTLTAESSPNGQTRISLKLPHEISVDTARRARETLPRGGVRHPREAPGKGLRAQRLSGYQAAEVDP